MNAGLLDELHVVVVPALRGSGQRLFENLGTAPDGWDCVGFAPSAGVTQGRLRRR